MPEPNQETQQSGNAKKESTLSNLHEGKEELEEEEKGPCKDPVPGPASAYGEELDAQQKAVAIFEQWCKGCEMCVYFCPKGVLAMTPHGKATVVNAAACIQCGLCWIHCPDFAIVSLEK